MVFEKVKIEDLIFPEYNPRKKLGPEDKEYQKIKKSIETFGYVDPVIVNKDNTIIGGNQRTSVLKELGYDEIDIVRIDVSKEKEKALNVALNKISGEWDFDKLGELLKELKLNNEDDFLLTGFNQKEFDKLMKEMDKDQNLDDDFDPEKALKEVVEPISEAGQLYQLGKHFLMCGDSTLELNVKRLLQGVEPILMVTDPPYGVKYDPSWRDNTGSDYMCFNGKRSDGKVQNDDLADWSAVYKLFPGDIAYVWHAGIYGHVVGQNLIDSGYKIVSQIIWKKQHFAISRGNYNWQHEPCQPAGTMITTPNGEVPIEKLKDGDCVVSYDSYSSAIIGKRKGLTIKKSKRFYDGDLFNIFVGNKNTKTTDNHKFTVRFSNDCDSKYGVYLMKKGNWWRIGITKLFNSRGFGLTVRLGNEKADAAWLLTICDKKSDAEIYEQMLSCKYGIPTTIWEVFRPKNGMVVKDSYKTYKQIEWIYSMLDLDYMFLNVLKLLKDFNKRIEFPLITKEETLYRPFGRNKTRLINACNLFEDVMCIPIPRNVGDSFDWVKINKIKVYKFKGFVYSLDVDKYEHYIADGIVTHNCFYVVKNNKKHNWHGGDNASTIWEIANNNRVGNKTGKETVYGHGTQKPIECMLRPIQNNTNIGQAVYDPFGGSGTTLIAAEKIGRVCYMMEIDPIYVDIIIKRYIDFKEGNMDDVFLIEKGEKIPYSSFGKYVPMERK